MNPSAISLLAGLIIKRAVVEVTSVVSTEIDFVPVVGAALTTFQTFVHLPHYHHYAMNWPSS